MSAHADPAVPFGQRVLAFAERRLPALTRLRQPEPLPIELDRRRIYVLPTGFGVVFMLLLMVMMLGALNYGNNPALLLTCVLGATAWMSIFSAFRTLAGLRCIAIAAQDCHAGEPIRITCTFDPGSRARPGLRLRCGNRNLQFALPAGAPGAVVIELPTTRRGWFQPGRFKLWSEQPFGFFVVWSWVNPAAAFLVYPRAERPAPPLPRGAGQHGDQVAVGDDGEFAGLRDYRVGDRPRLIAWKASARQDKLLARESERRAGATLVLDWFQLGMLGREARISRLTAWALSAETRLLAYTLNLPGQRIGPGLGTQHLHACLRALALLPDAAD